MPRSQTQEQRFEATAIAFVSGVVVTLLLVWSVNLMTGGRLVESFFGGPQSFDDLTIDTYQVQY